MYKFGTLMHYFVQRGGNCFGKRREETTPEVLCCPGKRTRPLSEQMRASTIFIKTNRKY